MYQKSFPCMEDDYISDVKTFQILSCFIVQELKHS